MTDEQNRMLVALYERYAASMVQLTYRRLRDAELARDLVHDVFLLACCKPDELFLRGSKPRVWLFRALEYLTIQERKRARHTRESLSDELEQQPSSETLHLDLEEIFPTALREEDRQILCLRITERLSYEEIAQRCGATPEACRQRYSRALRRCERLLAEKPVAKGTADHTESERREPYGSEKA